MKTKALLGLAVLAFVASACGSSSEESPTSEGGDTLTVEASSATRSAIGVVTWAIQTGKGTATVVRGYDAGHAAIVELEQKVDQGMVRTFQASLQANGHLAKMKLELESATALKTIENTFANDASAHGVLARIVDDLKTQPVREQVRSAKGSLHAAGLIENPNTTLLSKCSSALLGSASNGASTVDTCSSGASSSDCAASANKMPQAQGQVDQGCSCSDAASQDTSQLASCDPDRAKCAVPPMHRALLDTIAFTEGTAGSCGTDGYSTGFGYNCFDSCAQHPHTQWGSSTAAGRYQFLDFTWDELGKSDFGPANQDIAAIEKIRQRGVDLPTDRPLSESEFEAAMHKLSLEWASLPYSPYGQPTKTLQETRARYCDAAGGC
ncbi:glycoside hydrolase family 104 protein [Pendulispora brunnea]|uniref:Glycoside hydrolase family 104 protein n=1 Tax=Pendulispora brunnea TaxID=2905690 RepID=A0ABZ2JV41_9BACT